jgi:superfamily I DNA and RNA helicase
MHKLKEIYTSEENTKIFFTCHNIALANTLKHRIPEFFDFMRVEKQIKWNTQLWVDRAWGARADKNSGLYSYICDFYEIPFLSWSGSINYEVIFSKALEFINKLPTFEYAFDYILIDEKQDFPEVFFKLCEKITRFQVYIAGDIFQDIFQNNIKKEVQNVDYVLNRCYRTAPRILMFAHSIGMGLFENVKLNWLEDNEWISSGYKIKREGEKVTLTRESIRRFEELEEKNIHNMNVQQFVGEDQVIDIIEKIKNEHPTVEPSDIAVIMLDKSNDIYQFIDLLEYKIVSKFGWTVNKAFETKQKTTDQLFISNVNNVKGLEFPFVICITNKIRNNYSYRNSLYTMLTRAFLQSYLLINNYENVDCQIKGLDTINKLDCIETIEPSVEEKELIQRSIIKVKPTSSISFYDFMNEIFKEQNIDKKFRTKFIQALPEIYKEDFDRDGIIQFIQDNRKYYCL